MSRFKVGDKVKVVRSYEWKGNDRLVLGSIHVVSSSSPTGDLVRVDSEPQGWHDTRFELVEAAPVALPREWQDKIEAALGRDALVTLGVVDPPVTFKEGDRVRVAEGTLSYFGTPVSGKGTVSFSSKTPKGFTPVRFDLDELTWYVPTTALSPVETVKVKRDAVQVQFHIEGCDPARTTRVVASLLGYITARGCKIRGDVATNHYTYHTTEEV